MTGPDEGTEPAAEEPADRAPSEADKAAADRDLGDAGEDEEEEEPLGFGALLRELAVIVVTALVISVLVKSFLVQAFYIPSGSMEDTLLVNDRVLVNKLADKPDEIRRGDVVVFRDPGGWLQPVPRDDSGPGAKLRDTLVFLGLAPATSDEDLIKRVIGVGGDQVRCCDSQKRVTVNGHALAESSYLFPGNQPSEGQNFDVTVPQGSLWVMGDHRLVSEDSRAHADDARHGMVPVSDVIGRAFVIVWPLDRFGRLIRPATFHQSGLSNGSS